MNTTEIRRTVERLLSRIAPEVDIAGIEPGEDLRAQIDLDSIDYLNFMIALSREFKIEIRETDYRALASIDDLVEWLEARLQTVTSN